MDGERIRKKENKDEKEGKEGMDTLLLFVRPLPSIQNKLNRF